ncbi:ATP-binding protein [Tahibacter amnicola]|uniref:histidine kinase n=1 Tax=Tahibacter amnicola TaxID=2976241 RepID=A0ABY6BNS1_9GAMM|nr:ATP-binding protein [Tahibacter amnicola]UXI70045.1 ATP-binding protein [Tahibacter amnicola]
MILASVRSVRRKLLLVVGTVTLAALVVTGAALLVYDARAYRQTWMADLETQADILGRASAPALTFDDPKAAQENLALLKARPQVLAAAVYSAKGTQFASYLQHGQPTHEFPRIPELDGARVKDGELIVFKRIIDHDEIVGTVYLRARYELWDRLASYTGILGMAMVASLIVAVLLSYWLSREVTRPLGAVSDAARRVMEQGDFSVRAEKSTQDEVGILVDAFNNMLAEIGRTSETLENSNRQLAHEIAERAEAEAALHASERRHRTLVAALTSLVWTANAQGQFAEPQPSWETYTGQSAGKAQGLGWQNAIEPEDREAFEAGWQQATDSSEPFQHEMRLWHQATQSFRYVNFRAVPVTNAQGDVREWIGTVSDIHDQRMAEEALRELNAELEKRVADRTAELQATNRELEGFSYSVSHDLRAPVRAVAGFSKLLWKDHANQLDDEGRRKLEIIQNEALRMGVLIDDLLLFARLGRQAIKPVELDMRNMAESMYERLQGQQPGNPPEFHIGPLPHAVGDRVLLEQVWANFLSNALKFSSHRDHPVIEVDAISDATEHIYFVRDNGAGFDPRYQNKLFGVFQRLHSTSEFPGNGVGLALVHRIITRHGGRVWADSKPDEGAKFYFSLPKENPNGSH